MTNYMEMQLLQILGEFTVKSCCLYYMYIIYCSTLFANFTECKNGHPFIVTEVNRFNW